MAYEIDTLIVKHLADIDATAKRLHALESEIFSVIDKKATDWARQADWTGEFDYLGKVGLWLAPNDWKTPGINKTDIPSRAWFSLTWGAGDSGRPGTQGEDYFCLTRLCGVGSGEIGFRFVFRKDLISWKQWKSHLGSVTGLVEKTAFLPDSENSFFLPFRIEATKLAESLEEESLEEALGPFEAALAQLAEAKAAFDRLIAAFG